MKYVDHAVCCVARLDELPEENFIYWSGYVYGGDMRDYVQVGVIDFAGEMRRWFQKVNPWAVEEIVRRLVEATGRGICQPDQEFLECLCEGYLEVKGSIEDTMDAVFGKFQGGSVDIMTTEDVEYWKE